jgi:hypothetical protein
MADHASTCSRLVGEEHQQGPGGQGEEGVTGDHIDLWNHNEMGSYNVIRRIRTTFPTLGQTLGMSDLSKSTQVLFWEIK